MSRLLTQRLFAGNDDDGYKSQLYGAEEQDTEYHLDALLNMNETYSFAGHAESGMTGDNGPFEPMEVTVEITNHKLKFGIRSEGTASTKDFDFNLDDRTLSTGGVGWFKTDNFKLHCLERGELYNSIHSVGTDNGFRIYSFENCLVIDTDVATQINIYGIDGMLINAMKVEAGSKTVTRQPGFYVINGTKVVIK